MVDKKGVKKKKERIKEDMGEIKESTVKTKKNIQGKVSEAQEGAVKKTEKIKGKMGEAQEEAVKKTEEVKGKMGEAQEEAMKKAEEVKGKMGEAQEGALEKKGDIKEDIRTRRTQAENVFNDIIQSFKERQEEFGKAISDYTSSIQKPLTDVMETDDNIIIKTDLPGVKKEDIEIGITEDSVQVTAKFQEETSVEDVNFIQKERNYGETRIALTLPARVKVKEATGTFDNSVLTIELPKLEKKVHRVNIE
jgi:HSP20 family protein